ncbi:MAG: YraN family protein [Candidatus Bipolaricaulota bacterium]|nr:YraN family protein [Candidatus Bipolaricaulota bacterium]
MHPGDTPGRQAENDTCELLRNLGYAIVARNWASRGGELDIVARDGDTLVFVEVKARSGGGFGGPEAAVSHAKQRRIAAAAKAFMARTDADLPARFDVVAWEGDVVRIHRAAFSLDDVWPTD